MALTPAQAATRREWPNAARVRQQRRTLDVAFVNNMPDNALRQAERQFREALQATGRQVRLHLFTFTGILRSEDARQYLANGYAPVDDMLARAFDAVIVTGNEPRAARLDEEPYWRDLVRVIEWADARTASSLWSCLAAHAAVLHLHGIERRPLETKLSGVFSCATDMQYPLLNGLPSRVMTPHSRWNGLRKIDLLAHGYDVLSDSPEAGVDMFALQRRTRFVFLQGHPEYETDSLLREYRRDVGRYLRGETQHYPAEPVDYFSAEAAAVLRAFRRRSATNRDPKLFDVFPNVASPFAITNRWQPSTARFFRNWLDSIDALGATRVVNSAR